MMSNADIALFVDRLAYTDQVLLYNGEMLFFEACCCEYDENRTILSSSLDVYRMPAWDLVFSAEKPDPDACIKEFLSAGIFDGRTFYEVTRELSFVEEW